jgi:NAD(P)-dependent dehydrogenase (short-subunit alcohol dehydrogenase family)
VRVAVVSGANRGIGLEVVRELGGDGFAVVLGSRDIRAGEAAAAGIPNARAVRLDVTDQESVDRLAASLERVDVLVNNAGIYPPEHDLAAAQAAWEVNALGAWRLALALAPLLPGDGSGRIVNVSSEAGSLALMGNFYPSYKVSKYPAYKVSKAALNAVTRVLADELRGRALVNSICPGWVATRMGGADAPRTVAEGAESVLWAVRLPDDGPTGGFFRDGKPLPW